MAERLVQKSDDLKVSGSISIIGKGKFPLSMMVSIHKTVSLLQCCDTEA